MNNYRIGITETAYTDYVVEAETPEEAWRLFLIWADSNVEDICHRLDKNSCGWDFDRPELTPEKPDITHAELVSVAYSEIEEGGNE